MAAAIPIDATLESEEAARLLEMMRQEGETEELSAE
jgi:hypothetical protein